jgi:acetyltransferase-like isoleucine patch superfamily enzyme
MSILLGTCSYVNERTLKLLYWNHVESERSVVRVGNYSSLAGNITFFIDGNHRMDYASTFPFYELHNTASPKTGWGKGGATVGHDVWIAENCTILGGVHIGTGAVIAANSVVTKDVPEYCVYAGNPARLVKKRFDESTIAQLIESEWWNLPQDFIFNRLAPVQNDIHEWIRRVQEYKSR